MRKSLAGKVKGGLAEKVGTSDDIFMIVGLGNPGRRYMRSRHNVGYEVAGRFSERHSIRLRRKRKLRCWIGVGEVAGRKVVAVAPTTFMNRSGEAVASAVGFYGVSPRDLLVIVDDVNLPLGRLRIRSKGSDGGHNGLRSVIAWLGTTDFPRLRIGIGKPAPCGPDAGSDKSRSRPLRDFVLGDFGEKERAVIGDVIEEAAEAVDAILSEGMARAMSRYNRSSSACAQHADSEVPPHGCGLMEEGFEETDVSEGLHISDISTPPEKRAEGG